MVKRFCKDCARLTVAGLVGFAVTKLVRRAREEKREERHGLFHRVLPH